jgi:hypothetical protein
MEEPTIRETLESAIESVDSASSTTPASPPPPAAEPPSASAGSAGETSEPSPPADEPKTDRPRNPDGTFAPKQGTDVPKPGLPPTPPAPKSPDAAKKPAEGAPAEQPQQKTLRPPQSLKPAEREAFMSASPVLQEALVRREKEIQQALQQTAGARQFTQRMTEVLQPYIPLIQANGGDPFQFVGNLLYASNALTHGSPKFKAEVVASLIHQFGVDIEMLDSVLAGLPVQSQKPAADQQILPQVQQLVQQQLAPVQQLLGQIQQQRQQAFQAAYQKETQSLEQFAADPKHEFFEDVREIMADLVEVAASRGYELSYEDAYAQACQLHPDVRSVIMSRNSNAQLQNTAQSLTAAAQRAKAAAVSVAGGPASGVPGGAPAGGAAPSIRASIEQAIAAQAG